VLICIHNTTDAAVSCKSKPSNTPINLTSLQLSQMKAGHTLVSNKQWYFRPL